MKKLMFLPFFILVSVTFCHANTGFAAQYPIEALALNNEPYNITDNVESFSLEEKDILYLEEIMNCGDYAAGYADGVCAFTGTCTPLAWLEFAMAAFDDCMGIGDSGGSGGQQI